MKYFTIALMLILISVSMVVHAADKTVNYDYCKGKYPTQHSLIEYCYDRQMQSAHNVYYNYYNKYIYGHDAKDISEKGLIVLRCFMKYEEPSYDTYIYPLVEYCIEREFKAYDRFHENTE